MEVPKNGSSTGGNKQDSKSASFYNEELLVRSLRLRLWNGWLLNRCLLWRTLLHTLIVQQNGYG